MEKAAHDVPIVYGRNMSIGVNVFMELVARAAKALGDGYDVEILGDSPSPESGCTFRDGARAR